MSPIGRIFIVLNLLLSAAFLGWAANAVATNQDYKGRYEAKDAELVELKADLEGQLADLRTNLEAEENAKVDLRGQRDDLDAELGSTKNQLTQTMEEKKGLLSDVTSFKETVGSFDERIAQVMGDKDAAVEEARQFERERNEAVATAREAELSKSEAEKQLETAMANISDYEVQVATLQDQVGRLETAFDSLANDVGVDPRDYRPVPFIRGNVLTVKTVDGDTLVALNVGANDGVERQMAFEIAGGGNYKGQVVVREVLGDMCSALLVRTGPGGSISSGDSASTRL